MTSPHSRRHLKRSLVLSLASMTALAALQTPPAAAQEVDESSCTVPDSGLQERDDASALTLAAECGAEVLIRDSQDYTTRSFAQPDGSIATEFTTEPQWVPDDSGEWIDADPTVEVAEDGTVRTQATVSDLEFGAEGDTAFVTATNTDSESVSLEWAEPLPEPEIDGSTVVYPEVMPDVDLEVYAGVADFSYALVVKTPEAAADPSLERVELGLSSEGLSVAADTATDTAALSGADGEPAYTVDSPWMWDSSETEDASAKTAPMELEIGVDSLTVIPDQELLADPEAEYPIYIDPEFTDTTASSKEVFSQKTGISCGTSTELCVGAQLWEPDNALGYWRSSIRFNGLDAIANRDVQQATVWISQRHTGDAGGPNQTVRLYSMEYFDTSGSVSWGTFNSNLVSLVATDSVPTSNTAAGESDQLITWADGRTATRVQQLVDRGANTATFGIVSGANTDQEGNRGYFRKLDPTSASMRVWHAPLKPTKLDTNSGSGCDTSAPGSVINSLTPKLKLTAPPALRSSNTVQFYVYNSRSLSPIKSIEVHGVSSGQDVTVTVPSGLLDRGSAYRWRARVKDSDASSTRTGELTSLCHFKVNSLPSMPTGLKAEAASNQCGTQSNPTVVTTSTPKLSAIPSDPDGGKVTARFAVYPSSGAFLDEWDMGNVESGVVANTRVRKALADGLYRWNAATRDAFGSSDWPPYCWIKIDTTAPEPPDVLQVTTNPVPGGSVEFDFFGGADVSSFRYSFGGGAYQYVSGTTGQGGVSINLPESGSIDHTLEVWARDFAIGGAGNTSSATRYIFTAMEAQPAEALGAWRFDGDLLDDAGEHDLTALGTALSGADREGRPDAAAAFDGTSSTCLQAGAPIVETTKSYTIAGWVYVDAAPSTETAVMDVTGESTSNLKLLLSTGGLWGVSMREMDGTTETTAVKAPPEATQFGAWTHVAAVYDAAAVRLRLYVNGTLMGSKTAPGAWEATGTFSVGCGIKSTGSTFGNLTGSVDDAVIFQQPLTDEQIDELMTGKGIPAALQAWYPLRYDDTPGAIPGADYSGRGADLVAMPENPAWAADQHGRASSALRLDGSTCPTAGEVPVRTDDSFSVSAWVRLDPEGTHFHDRIFEFHGDQYFSAMAKYNTTNSGWSFALAGADDPTATWAGNSLEGSAQLGHWTQIMLVVDRTEEYASLYIDGEFAIGRGLGTITPWRSSEMTIGCGGTADGARQQGLVGAISDVRVWRGALDAAEIAATHTGHLAAWPLDQDFTGEDEWGTADLTFKGDASWEVDRWNDYWAAYGLALGGTGWAETAGPVITTDESFTVAAWARVDDLSEFRTIVAQSGTTHGAFKLGYNPANGRIQFSMAQNDAEGTRWTRAIAQESPVIDESTGLGKWYHLTGQVDLGAGVIRLYIDGVLQSEAPVVESPWQANGSLTIGAAEQFGEMTNQMVGGIDQVQTWSGVLDPLAIADIAADRPKFELDPTAANCGGSPEPPADL